MSIIAKFPKNLLSLLQKLEKEGVSFCLVGGGSRDFLLNGNLVTDLDFEYRLKSNNKSFIEILKTYQQTVEVLPYEIYRFDFEGYSLEFSLPRVEENLADNNSHHHFTPSFSSAYTYTESFKRRDLTINAIGIELNVNQMTEKIIDPYNGVADLKRKILREVSNDFYYDYVRLFRLVRFKMKFQYDIAPSLLSSMDRFDLGHISYFHLKQELEKSKAAGLFLKELRVLTLTNKTLTGEMAQLLAIDFPANIQSLNDLIENLIGKRHFILADFLIRQFHLKKSNYTTLFCFVENYDFLIKNSHDLENLEFKKALKYYLEHPFECRKLNFSEIYPLEQYEKIQVDQELLLKEPLEKRAFYKIEQYIKQILKKS